MLICINEYIKDGFSVIILINLNILFFHKHIKFYTCLYIYPWICTYKIPSCNRSNNKILIDKSVAAARAHICTPQESDQLKYITRDFRATVVFTHQSSDLFLLFFFLSKH